MPVSPETAVIRLDVANSPTGASTMEVSEILNAVRVGLGATPPQWITEGIPVRYLDPAGNAGWQEGKARIVVEFVPGSLTTDADLPQPPAPPARPTA